MTTKTKMILASASPRRKELLGLGGWDFEIISAEIDETPLDGESSKDYVIRLGEEKARAADWGTDENAVIISADTTVADGDKILGKPANADDVRATLKDLRGRTHQVYTGLAVYQPGSETLYTELGATDVPMRSYSDEEIEAYIASGDPFDKAGSYAIQHPEFKPVNELTGCRANVVGLPLCHLQRSLRKLGILPEVNLQQACQDALNYTCTVYDSILEGGV
ncbi:MAG: Maf family protein [Chloroflexota bacterium]